MDSDYLKQVADRVRIECDARSPRLRLSVIGYLTEAGYLPNDPSFMENVNIIIDWVCADTEAYAVMVEAMTTEEKVEEGFSEVRNGYEILDGELRKKKDGGGYL